MISAKAKVALLWNTAASARGLTATVSGTTVTLYATTGGTGSAGGGSIYKAVDSAGYNAAPNGTSSVIATAATNTAFRGIALAPVNASPSPAVPSCARI